MSETVSKPNHHSNRVPTRRERDAAYSNDGGRKAIEEPIEQIEKEGQLAEEKKERADKQQKTTALKAPIGLDAETKAQSYQSEEKAKQSA
jgi:hypothetical protein